ncbi:MAG: MGH1-like glycoside hydrolase domain-containing protein [Acidobacteriaceae bacterium]
MRAFRILAFILLGAILASAQFSETVQEPKHFLVAHGRRAWASGYKDGGLEIWAGELQLATSIRPEFLIVGEVTPIPGETLANTIRVEPSHFVRTYIGPNFAVDEEVWVPLDRPSVLIRYEVRSARPVQIILRFRPSLDLMWPASLGGQEVRWDSQNSGYWMTDASRQFAAVVLAPGAFSQDPPLNKTQAVSAGGELSIALGSRSPEVLFSRVPAAVLLAGNANAMLEDAKELLNSRRWEQRAREHYLDVLDSELRIETPEDEVNRALAWAEIALDQDWFCNEKLGCGYVAGFGPSRKSRRPQYAWYFAGDGMVAARAAVAIGDLEHAREEIRFIAKYQDASSGMIWHEISQSAPYLDWRNKYPYMFVHADLTYPYISLVRDYIDRSNDRAFLREIWPSVEKAFGYGRSLVGSDGLPEIPAEKEGANEQHPLADELDLSVSWVTACDDFAELATLMGENKLADEARPLAERARASFSRRYWDAQRNFALQGHERNGSPVEDRGLGGLAAVGRHLFSREQSSHLLDEIASARFQSDWGTRSVAEGEPEYDPAAYASGSVWAVETATVAGNYWAEHRPDIAWQIWRALLPWSRLDSPGHMNEVLAGDIYRPQLESVPEQTWSSASFLSSAVEGLLGLHVDAKNQTLTIAPHLPPGWDHLSIHNLKLEESILDFDLRQDADGVRMSVRNRGKPVHVRFDPEIPLGARVLNVTVNAKKVAYTGENHAQDQHVNLQFLASAGSSDVAIHYRDGIALVFPAPHPVLGMPSKAMKPTAIALSGNLLRIGVDVLDSDGNEFRLRTSRSIEDIEGAKFEKTGDREYLVTLAAQDSGNSKGFEHRQVLVKFGKQSLGRR